MSTAPVQHRPPFPPGNALAVTTGHRSVRVYGELAEHLAAGLVEDRPDLVAYPEAVAAWATAEAQSALLRRRLGEVGPLDDDGEPRANLLYWMGRLDTAATKHRAALGLDPRSEAALAKERAEAGAAAVDLAVLAQRGREALAARERAGIPPPPDLAGQVLASQVAAEAAERAEHDRAWRAERGIPEPPPRTSAPTTAPTPRPQEDAP